VRRLSSKTAVEDATLNLSMLTLLRKTLRGIIFGNANPHYDIPQSKRTPTRAPIQLRENSRIRIYLPAPLGVTRGGICERIR
jgi:hypothetical protein